MKRSILAIMGILMLALMGSVTAQSMDEMTTSVSGTVVSSTSDMLVIETDGGQRMTFNLDSQSDFPANLAVGTRVNITYHTLEGGKYHAAKVTTVGTTSTFKESESTYTTNENLPKTASRLPLVLGIGLIALGGASALLFISRRIA